MREMKELRKGKEEIKRWIEKMRKDGSGRRKG